MLQLKVCGMADSSNITELAKIQPDFIGFIFHETSPRNVVDFPDLNIPKTIKKVGVFVDKDIDFISKKVNEFGLDYIQLHGKESPLLCEKLKKEGLKIIKAFNVHDAFDFSQLKDYAQHCDYFLFDAFGKNEGGNGILFDWNLLERYKGNVPFLLSGGIDETMVNAIKKVTHPQFMGIDINSGFEIKPALKNIEKIKNFIQMLKN
ncbi:MAG: phosphoribosylanthranilate isomerase [Vicingus serpentipes]|nr:phosphoribosylanthranilate isomerase [Vicingus serpentipes]